VSSPQQLFDLSGKVAIVTGSTKGIGRAMVEGLAAAGASVVVSSRKQDLCEQVATEIETATGNRAFPLACHVGDWDAIASFVETVRAELGRIDVLVNNAAITPARLYPSNMERDIWRKIFNVNVEGPLRMSQCVVPAMRGQGGGSIINIGSMAGYLPGPLVCAYGASKAALINLTKSMAQEFAQWNIRVNVLSPRTVHERDDTRGRPPRARLPRDDRQRHAAAARRGPEGDRRSGPLSRQRRVVVRDR
jgi:NAD(P)-dependent dehydrogenase (short-subunit alcohol dehydrogenase family)